MGTTSQVVLVSHRTEAWITLQSWGCLQTEDELVTGLVSSALTSLTTREITWRAVCCDQGEGLRLKRGAKYHVLH